MRTSSSADEVVDSLAKLDWVTVLDSSEGLWFGLVVSDPYEKKSSTMVDVLHFSPTKNASFKANQRHATPTSACNFVEARNITVQRKTTGSKENREFRSLLINAYQSNTNLFTYPI